MTSHFDPQTLDAAWDALNAGSSLSGFNDAPADRALLELLRELPRLPPTTEFIRALESELSHSTGAVASTQSAAVPPASAHQRAKSQSRTGYRDWMPRGGRLSYAVAALALVIVLSAVALVLQQSPDEERVIPAIGERAGQSPPTSPEAEITSWFSRMYALDDLAPYAVDRWSWIEMVEGTIRPGERPPSSAVSSEVATPAAPGMYFLTVKSGKLAVDLGQSASLFHQESEPVEIAVGPGEVTLQTGDTLISTYDVLSAIWNPTSDDAGFLAMALTGSQDRLERPAGFARGADSGNMALPGNLNDSAESLEISIDQVVLDPGEIFAYTITPQTVLLANSGSGFLEKQAWVDGKPFGDALKVLAMTPYILNNYGTGSFTLTNTSSKPVTVSFFQVAPPDTGAFVGSPATPVDSPFGTYLPAEATPDST
jgi:hypothetical protein